VKLELIRLAFWAALLFAFVMAVIPQPPQLPGAPSDKVQHILAFSVLTALAVIGYPQIPLLHIGLALAAFGALIEVIQLIPALNRSADFIDWVADVVAVAVVLLIAWPLREIGGI
jgi:hypothetical protein